MRRHVILVAGDPSAPYLNLVREDAVDLFASTGAQVTAISSSNTSPFTDESDDPARESFLEYLAQGASFFAVWTNSRSDSARGSLLGYLSHKESNGVYLRWIEVPSTSMRPPTA